MLQQVSGSASIDGDRARQHSREWNIRSDGARRPDADDRDCLSRVLTDASYAAAAKIAEAVSAGVQLTVSPRRTGSEGTITLSGQVLGPVPAQGVAVELLVHYRGRWEPFRVPQTDSRGRFEVVYQFQGGVGRFPFRASVLGGQAGFPFVHGESEAVDVTTN